MLSFLYTWLEGYYDYQELGNAVYKKKSKSKKS